MYKIYYYKSPEEKYYIGHTKRTIQRRAKSGYYSCPKFYEAIQKFGGLKNYERGIIKEVETKEEALYWEDFYTQYYDSQDNGYNIKSGAKQNEETAKKISEGHKGVSVSEETKEKLRQANLGKKQSEETIKKKSEALIGRKRSEDVIVKIAQANTGKKRSEEAKKKISEGAKGRIISEEQRKKISAGLIRYWQTKKGV